MTSGDAASRRRAPQLRGDAISRAPKLRGNATGGGQRQHHLPAQHHLPTHGHELTQQRDATQHHLPAQHHALPSDGPPAKPTRPGYVPRDVRRAVFLRDGEQCTYMAADGSRCPARGHLELDHVHPRALGGDDTEANLRLRCRAHNALYAEQVFGRAHVERRIYLRRRKYAAPSTGSLETTANALRSLGFREPEVRRALSLLGTKPDLGALPVEAMLREALRMLT